MLKLPAENVNRSTDRADVVGDAGPVVTWLRAHPVVVDSVGALFSVVFGLAMTVLTPLLILASVVLRGRNVARARVVFGATTTR